MIRLLASVVALAMATSASAATLEVPANGGTASGIGFISGWKCPPNTNISIVIDGGAPIPVAAQIRRGDTASTCRNSGNNGFITQVNFGLLGDGQHTVSVRQNGAQFARATFDVVTFGVPFLSGAAGAYVLENFPLFGQSATVQWNEGTQSFVVIDASGQPRPTPAPPPAPSRTPRPTPTPIPTPAPTPIDFARVRFENGVTCFGSLFTASMSANGYGWSSFTGVPSQYQDVDQRFLGPVTTVLGGCGRYNFGTFSLTYGRRYRFEQGSVGGPVMRQYDEGAFAGSAAADVATDEPGVLVAEVEGEPVDEAMP